MDTSKALTTSKLNGAIDGGAKSSSAGSGVTGSKSSYPKGSAPNMDTKRFNPMNGGKSTYGVAGVGK